jgi:hypothetical protein
VALIGAAGFLVAFATVLSGLGEDSPFGYGSFLGVLALVVWSFATSVARYRALGAPADQLLRRCDEVGIPAIRSPKGLDLDDMIEVVEASLPPKKPR